jgi:hypothetical protein
MVRMEKKLRSKKRKLFVWVDVIVMFKAITGIAITPTAEAISDEYHLKVWDR